MNNVREISILLLIVFCAFIAVISGSYFFQKIVPDILPHRAPTEMIVNGEPCVGYYYYKETSSTKRTSTNSLVVECNNGTTYHNVTNLKVLKN